MERIEGSYDACSGDGPAVGLIVLSSDEVLERELRAWLPSRMRLFHSRIGSDRHVSADSLRAMEHRLATAARMLPASADLRAIGYGCTSASSIIGEARIARLIASAVPDVPVTDPMTALGARLGDLGVRRIALLSPYVPTVADAIVQALERIGIEVVHAATFDQPDDSRVARLSERSVAQALLRIGQREHCEAVFGSCTNLRAFGVLDEVQRRLGKPVLTSNSVLAWHLERLVER